MININGLKNKFLEQENSLKLRSIFSAITIGIFIFFGFASFLEDDSVFNCDFYNQPTTIRQSLNVELYDKEDYMPIKNQIVTFTITLHKKTKNANGGCEIKTSGTTQTLSTSATGIVTLTLNNIYESSDDYVSVEYSFKNPSYSGDTNNFDFDHSNTNETKRKGYLRNKVYP